MKNEPFCTIGHSTRSIGEGSSACCNTPVWRRSSTSGQCRVRARNPERPGGADVLAGVRDRLRASGGARRPAQRRDVPRDLNAFWRSEELLTTPTTRWEDFRADSRGCASSIATGVARSCAPEAVWWRYHRRRRRYLLTGGAGVLHLAGARTPSQPALTIRRAQSLDVLAYPALPESGPRDVSVVTGPQAAVARPATTSLPASAAANRDMSAPVIADSARRIPRRAPVRGGGWAAIVDAAGGALADPPYGGDAAFGASFVPP